MKYFMKNLDLKYFQAYKVIKDFHSQMKNQGWGEGCLPSKYTEDLCKETFGFKNREDQSHDAIDIYKSKIEIKATIGDASATTINTMLAFDKLYWLRFDFDNDIVHVKVYEKQEVQSYLASCNKLTDNRESITLNKIVNGKNDDHTIEFI